MSALEIIALAALQVAAWVVPAVAVALLWVYRAVVRSWIAGVR